jgi:hypothetical protein
MEVGLLVLRLMTGLLLAGGRAWKRRGRSGGHALGEQAPARPDRTAGVGEPPGADVLPPPRPRHEVVILLDDLDKATARALSYARTLRPMTVTALHVAVDPVHAQALAEQWARLGLNVPLEVVSCPDRDLPGAVRQALTERLRPDTAVTVLIPRHHYGRLLDLALHDRTAQRLLRALEDLDDGQGALHLTVMPYRVGRRPARRPSRRQRPRAPRLATSGAA